jgi:hypothetical protein
MPRDRTVRHPNNSKYGNIKALNQKLNSFRMDCNRLAIMMMQDDAYRIYRIFATDGSPNPKFAAPDHPDVEDASGSLEALHGLYHDLIGDSGHMGSVAVAAFDPIFVSLCDHLENASC